MRTPENVVAVDWQTGKRIWETRDEQELDSDDAPPTLPRASITNNGRTGQAARRANVGRCAGHRAFQRRQPGFRRPGHVDDAQTKTRLAGRFQPGFGRIGIESPSTTNQLAAYDLATQGKLAWELDGGRTAGTLAGAFFLGPPVAIDNTLYRNGRNPQRAVSARARSGDRASRMAAATGWSGTGYCRRPGPAASGGDCHRIRAACSFARPGLAPPSRSMWSNANSRGSIDIRAKPNDARSATTLATTSTAKPARARKRPMAR